MNNDRLEKLRSLLTTVNESITKQEFVTSFKAVLDFVKQIDLKNTAEFDNIKVQFKHLASSLKLANKDELDDLKAMVNNALKDSMAEMMVECDAKMQAMDLKMSQVRDGIDGLNGMDADEKKVMEMVLAKIPPVEPNEPLDIVDKLESLKGEYRLDASAIKNLPEPKGGRFGGGLSRGVADTLYAPIGEGGGSSTWGGITGTLSDQTDLQDALDAKADALTADQNYVTDAQLVVIGNTSGTNTGDQDLSGYSLTSHNHNGVYAPVLGVDDNYVTDAEKVKLGNLSGTNTGDQDLSGYQPLDTQLTALAGISYTGNALKYIRINAGENGFELATVTGGSGISRSVVTTVGSATMGSAADTDYTYYVAGLHTMSLPSPNTNRYTIKNLHSAAITVDTAGAENIEGAANISLQPNDSVDIMSDGTNWYVH